MTSYTMSRPIWWAYLRTILSSMISTNFLKDLTPNRLNHRCVYRSYAIFTTSTRKYSQTSWHFPRANTCSEIFKKSRSWSMTNFNWFKKIKKRSRDEKTVIIVSHSTGVIVCSQLDLLTAWWNQLQNPQREDHQVWKTRWYSISPKKITWWAQEG